MKKLFAVLPMLALVAIAAGCVQGKPGGPGTDGKSPSIGQAEDTFNLSVPILSSSLQQGEQTEATVGIKRAKNFDEDVTLKFTDLPKGVSVEPASPTIKHGDIGTKFTFKADEQAALGDFKIKVTGHPSKGSDAEVDLSLAIAAKDTFTLTVPRLSLKQGETETISIGVERQKSFNEPVALSFGDLPKGITLAIDEPQLQAGEAEAKVTLTASEDASLGDFTIQVTGHPKKGADATKMLNITVAQQ